MEMKVKPKKSEVDNDGDSITTVSRPGIFVNDLDEFTAFVIRERNLDPRNVVIQFGFDDGQVRVIQSSENPTIS